ncbi:MAG: hypothetical protein ACJA0Q_000042 [Saprospiraceae bacterium]
MRDLFYLPSFKFQTTPLVMKTLRNTCYIFILNLILTSCSSEEIDRTQYFPEHPTMVVKFNATGYIQDTFDDYLTDGKGIYDEVVTGIAGVFMAPGAMGVESMTDHFLFVQELENKEQVIGLILALSEGKKFTAYLKSMNLVVEDVAGLNHVMLNDSTNLVWDKKTAIVQSYSNVALFDKYNTIALFEERSWDKEAEVRTRKAIQDFKNSEAHFTLWNSGASNSVLFSASKFFQEYSYLVNMFTSDNEVSLMEFEVEKNRIRIKQKIYLPSNEVELSMSQRKANSFSDDLVFIPTTKPEAWFSASLSQKAMLKMLKGNKELSVMFDENLSVLLNMEEVCDYLNGDVFFSYNGVDVREKMVFESEFNQETGEYESGEVSKKVEQKFYTLALGLKENSGFSEKLMGISMFLNINKGVYNFKEEFFFQIKNNIVYLATSPKSIELFSGELGKSTAEHLSLMTENELAAALKFNSEVDLYFPIKGIRELNVKKAAVEEYLGETEFNLVFDKDKNAVIELTSILIQLIDKIQ